MVSEDNDAECKYGNLHNYDYTQIKLTSIEDVYAGLALLVQYISNRCFVCSVLNCATDYVYLTQQNVTQLDAQL